MPADYQPPKKEKVQPKEEESSVIESVDLSALFPDMSQEEFEKAKRDLFADTSNDENSAELLHTPSESLSLASQKKSLEEPLIVTNVPN